MKKNIFALIGARPQIIKHSAIERAVRTKFHDEINLVTIHSGQHYSENMSAIFFEEMGIEKPNFNLGIGSSSHAEQTASMMQKLETLFNENPCDALVVYGDTNSTLAGALVASKRQIPLVHIEAGLRSFDKKMPEEINRILTDHVSSVLFCPTKTAIENLKNEAVVHHHEGQLNSPAVFECGDIMYDNSLYFSQVAHEKTNILKQLDLQENQFVLATVHRAANTDDREKLTSIFEAFLEIGTRFQQKIILPLHPRTKKMMEQFFSTDFLQKIEQSKQLQLIEPVGFLEMTALESACKMLLTDSGGVQKEAYFFKKPCVILRPHTEWVEIIENGCGILAASDKTRIVAGFQTLSEAKLNFPPVFGDGKAAEFILQKIVDLC